MKLTTPFTILRDALQNKTSENVSCSIDDLEVPIKECGLELEASMEEPNLDSWDEECEGPPINSHYKVYNH